MANGFSRCSQQCSVIGPIIQQFSWGAGIAQLEERKGNPFMVLSDKSGQIWLFVNRVSKMLSSYTWMSPPIWSRSKREDPGALKLGGKLMWEMLLLALGPKFVRGTCHLSGNTQGLIHRAPAIPYSLPQPKPLLLTQLCVQLQGALGQEQSLKNMLKKKIDYWTGWFPGRRKTEPFNSFCHSWKFCLSRVHSQDIVDLKIRCSDHGMKSWE